MGLFTVVTIILAVLKALGFIGLSWFWVFLPLAVDIILAVVLYLTVGLTFFKTSRRIDRSFDRF